MVGAARGDPGFQVLAQFRSRCQISLFNFHLHKMPPIAYRALDGHLRELLHGFYPLPSRGGLRSGFSHPPHARTARLFCRGRLQPGIVRISGQSEPSKSCRPKGRLYENLRAKWHERVCGRSPLWSAAACCRFPPRELARGFRTCHNSDRLSPCFRLLPASELAGGKRQQAAALQSFARQLSVITSSSYPCPRPPLRRR